ncbi:DUF6542 domain-containing protein [Aeromicrobium sp.]
MSTSAARSPAALTRHDLGAGQAVVFACIAMASIALLDLLGDGKLGVLFSVGFILVAVTTPLSVEVRALFAPGILPPLLMIGSILVLAIVSPSAIPAEGLADSAGTLQRLIAGVIDQATALVVGHLLALGVIAVRIMTAPA